ncbi:helix-turn-helix transcriptional regulator [Muricauda sp. ANG21]|uniref:helix-turn-helix domain-containing protein n=1 Tax=Allomuricauda sp. ANG21 TaxID=3042468 RepID=UPI003456821F
MDKSKEIKKLAERIKSLRLQKGYSSYEGFANDHGIHRAQFGRYETGTDMQYTSLLKIAQAFDMTLDEFFSEGFD